VSQEGPDQSPSPSRDRWLEVLAAFGRLGLTSFGGPVAHIGYFRQEFVTRRKWLDERAFADLVALCQFLPGPASSQTGFAIGLMRAGPLGGLAAWIGFTLPSAILMTAFAYRVASLTGPGAQGAIHGLKLVAVAVVAQAVLGMARSMTPDVRRAAIALAAVAIVTLAAATIGQVAAIGLGALAGLVLCRDANEPAMRETALQLPRRVGVVALGLLLALLVGGPVLSALTTSQAVARFDAFYRSGALVFGGGHVVLPLLKDAVVDRGWVRQGDFLAGYGAAQAMPGPLFTFAAYLGAVMRGSPNGLVGAALGLLAIFLPGLLALLAALPFWGRLRARPDARAAMQGANAAVVGILAAALYNPVWTGAIADPADGALALSGLVLLSGLRTPPVFVVVLGAGVGVARTLM
jgi:chromate transporter